MQSLNSVVTYLLIGALLMIIRPCDSYLWHPVNIQKTIHSLTNLLLPPSNPITYFKSPSVKSDKNEFKERILLKVKYYNRWSSWCSTSTITTTSTSTISTNTFCATLFNVRGACRRRRKILPNDVLDLSDNELLQPTKKLTQVLLLNFKNAYNIK
jgi:hypothetical protein